MIGMKATMIVGAVAGALLLVAGGVIWWQQGTITDQAVEISGLNDDLDEANDTIELQQEDAEDESERLRVAQAAVAEANRRERDMVARFNRMNFNEELQARPEVVVRAMNIETIRVGRELEDLSHRIAADGAAAVPDGDGSVRP